MTTFAVNVLPNSLVRAPQFTYSMDGHSSNPYRPFEDREQAEEFMFAATADIGGYTIAYVGDGYVLCRDCALDAWRDPDNSDHDAIHNGEISASVWHEDTEDSAGVTCDNCNDYIIEPFCLACWDANPPHRDHDALLPEFAEPSFGGWMHGACMAELVAKGDAIKAGKQTYDVEGGYTYRATYTAR